MKKVIALFLLLVPSVVFSASVEMGRNVTINNIVHWQDNSHIMLFLSNGKICYVHNAEKNSLSIALTMYTTGKSLIVRCHDDQTFTRMGYTAYRLNMMFSL